MKRNPTAMKEDYRTSILVPTPVRLAGILLILACGLIHLIAAPEHYEEASYIGVLFFANCAGALLAAVGIYQNRLWVGWSLGALVAGGAVAMFLASRSIGLPAYEEHVGMWIGDSPEDYIGIPSVIVEALFVALALAVIARLRVWGIRGDKEERVGPIHE